VSEYHRIVARVVAIIQARIGSTRRRGKVLANLAGRPVLAHVVDRTIAAHRIDDVVVAAPYGAQDDVIEEVCKRQGWNCFRGSEDDVLDRYYRAALAWNADHAVRVTADCPLLCPVQLDRVVSRHLEAAADYTHNITVWGSGMPLGTGGEIFRFAALERSWQSGNEPRHREHVDEYVGEHPELFHIERVEAPPALRHPDLRLTVDTPEDIVLLAWIYDRLYRPDEIIDLRDVVKLLDAHPEVAVRNRDTAQDPS
jgi:spore coat polysaccharide biosynthesis protein SpsF (cytidylyltransferase family)